MTAPESVKPVDLVNHFVVKQKEVEHFGVGGVPIRTQARRPPGPDDKDLGALDKGSRTRGPGRGNGSPRFEGTCSNCGATRMERPIAGRKLELGESRTWAGHT